MRACVCVCRHCYVSAICARLIKLHSINFQRVVSDYQECCLLRGNVCCLSKKVNSFLLCVFFFCPFVFFGKKRPLRKLWGDAHNLLKVNLTGLATEHSLRLNSAFVLLILKWRFSVCSSDCLLATAAQTPSVPMACHLHKYSRNASSTF